jgi:hypothetical protein
MKKLYIILFIAIAAVTYGQKKVKLDDLQVDVYYRSSGNITQNNVFQGHYLLYAIDKPKKKMQDYALVITDENATAINRFNFTESSDLFLIESSYQDGEICFKFLDNKNKDLKYKTFDVSGKRLLEYTFELDKSEYRKYMRFSLLDGDADFAENTELFDLEGEGFCSVAHCEVDKMNSFKLLKFTKGSKKVEVFPYVSKSKFNSPDFLGTKDGIAFFKIEKMKGAMAKTVIINILAIDIRTWKKVFETNGEELGEYIFVPSSLVEDPFYKTIKFVGTYYKNDDNVFKDESQGLALWELKDDGTLLREKYNEWSKDFKVFLGFDAKNRSKEMGYIHIHKTLTLADGKIVAVGEGYKKVVDGAGLAFAALSGGRDGNITKMQVNDLAVFKFDADFNFLDGDRHKKKVSSGALEGGDFLSVHLLAKILKAYGFFDYRSTQLNEERTEYVIGYTNFDRASSGKKELQYISLHYTGDKPTKDVIEKSKDAQWTIFYPNQFGRVTVTEYFKKQKKIDQRIVKVK